MAEPFKNMFNADSIGVIAKAIKAEYKSFRPVEFLKSTMDETWDSLELMARARKIATTLREYLPADYREAVTIMEKSLTKQPVAFFFPVFVEIYGQEEDDWDFSVSALGRTTEYWSAEFAVRPFIIKDCERMMAQMYAWSKDENENVRRLSSEGCRPQLPWGQALAEFKKDPAPILPILEQLKADPSLFVRKSVANNINDISKTHPDLIISLAKKWQGKNKDTDWILKHGCRTLLKKGNREALALFGYDDVAAVDVTDFALDKKTIAFGEDITFSFTISSKQAVKTRLEYGVDFVRANGKSNRKIFQISEIMLKENEKKAYSKKHSFAEITTRKYYPGTHTITLIVNGAEQGQLSFELKE